MRRLRRVLAVLGVAGIAALGGTALTAGTASASPVTSNCLPYEYGCTYGWYCHTHYNPYGNPIMHCGYAWRR